MNTKRSDELFARAQQLIPGGVNSPVRACRNVHADPLFIADARGSHLTTVDGEDVIDFLGSWGPMLVGHAHPAVTEAICRAAARGTSYGAPCEDEVRLAEEVCNALPSVEMVRMVNSGTEATMSALRLARGVTGRERFPLWEETMSGRILSVRTVSRPVIGRNSCSENGMVCFDY